MEIKHTQAQSMQKILRWLVDSAPFQYKITTHQNGELHIKMEVPETDYNEADDFENEEEIKNKIPESVRKELHLSSGGK